MYQQGFLAMQDIFTFGMFVHYCQKPHYVFEIHIVLKLEKWKYNTKITQTN